MQKQKDMNKKGGFVGRMRIGGGKKEKDQGGVPQNILYAWK